jgi:hypothetical protein
MCGPILLKPAIPFILFQQSTELSQNIWMIIRSNCLFKAQKSHNLFSRQYTPNTNLWRIHRIFVLCMPSFQHSMFYGLLFWLSTQV